MKNNDPEAIGKLLNCLSLLEGQSSVLYQTIAEKVEIPFVKSLMLAIAHDSQKHSTLLKGIGESISQKDVKPKECQRNLGASLRAIVTLQMEIEKKGKLADRDLLELSEKLEVLESAVGEEYHVFMQLKTLVFMTEHINRDYEVDLSSLKTVFARIINDEEHHRELIAKTRGIIERKGKPKGIPPPIVRYQNPDAWIRATS